MSVHDEAVPTSSAEFLIHIISPFFSLSPTESVKMYSEGEEVCAVGYFSFLGSDWLVKVPW